MSWYFSFAQFVMQARVKRISFGHLRCQGYCSTLIDQFHLNDAWLFSNNTAPIGPILGYSEKESDA
jgi:hypothetical protein